MGNLKAAVSPQRSQFGNIARRRNDERIEVVEAQIARKAVPLAISTASSG
jgi:hypothetical protein